MDWLGDLGKQTGGALQGLGDTIGDGFKWTENAAKSALPSEVKVGFIKIQIAKEDKGTAAGAAPHTRPETGGGNSSACAHESGHREHRAAIPIGFIKIGHPCHDCVRHKKESKAYLEAKAELEKNKKNLAKELKEIDRQYHEKYGI